MSYPKFLGKKPAYKDGKCAEGWRDPKQWPFMHPFKKGDLLGAVMEQKKNGEEKLNFYCGYHYDLFAESREETVAAGHNPDGIDIGIDE